MTLEFLSPAESALARSPMEREARAASATIELRDGWTMAVAFGGDEAERLRSSAGFADRSHLGKLELQATAEDMARMKALDLGTATREDDAWCCPYSRERALVLCEPADTAAVRARLEDAAAGASGLAAPSAASSCWATTWTSSRCRLRTTPVSCG